MRKPIKKDCFGCTDNFYNHNRMGANESSGYPECWSFKNAKLVKALDVPVNMAPPYKSLSPVNRPNCYHAKGFVRVPQDKLTKDGYWKPWTL